MSSILKKFKRSFLMVGVLIVLIFFIVGSYFQQTKKLIVTFFDIGQGDSALIVLPTRQTVLIDGGPDNLVLRRLGDALPFYQRHIDIIIFSHYHSDHITGLIEVMKRYNVKEIIYAPSDFSSQILKIFWLTAKKQKIYKLAINTTAQLKFSSDCSLYFLNPKVLKVKKDQNNSLTVRLLCRQQSFLFTGDNPATVERALVNYSWLLQANILKIGHHGSNSASTIEFLQKVNPFLAVISVGKDNKFGHPGSSTLEHLNSLGIEFKRTDQDGSIKIVSP